MMWKNKKVLIMAGGTGGHVYPALAVAHDLSKRGAKIYWLGNENGFESALVKNAGYEFLNIPVTGVRGKLSIKVPIMLGKALFYAWKHIRNLKPDLVLGMGGFAAAPGGIIASFLKIPLFIHEQNAIFGLTNKILAPRAKKVLLGFSSAAEDLKRKKIKANIEVVGNPVREEIANLPEPKQRWQNREGALEILVLGGSQGASALNELLPEALNLIPSAERPKITHQVGKNKFTEAEALYQKFRIEVTLIPYIEDMASAYSKADLVIARSGALTVAEIATAGISALFIPYPYAVDNHQYFNAKTLADNGAAKIIEQNELNADKLADFIKNQQRENLLILAEKAREQTQAQAINLIRKNLESAFIKED